MGECKFVQLSFRYNNGAVAGDTFPVYDVFFYNRLLRNVAAVREKNYHAAKKIRSLNRGTQ